MELVSAKSLVITYIHLYVNNHEPCGCKSAA